MAESTEIPSICCRIANLDFLDEHLNNLYNSYFPNCVDINDLHEIITHSMTRVAEYMTCKLTFVDFGNTIFQSLYVGDAKFISTFTSGLCHELEILKLLRKRTPQKVFKRVLEVLLKGLMSGWLYYILIDLTTVKAEELKDLPVIVKEDMQQLKDFFCAKDAKGEFQGLTNEYVNEQIRAMEKFVQYAKTDDYNLIALYKNISVQDEYWKEMITRLLYGRGCQRCGKIL